MHLAEPISSETRLPAAAGSARELVRVALPLVISSGSASLMYVMDRVFLTWYSTDAMAATLPAGMLHWTLVSLALGTTGYVNTFVAQYYGAGEPRRIGAVVWQGIWLSLIAGLALRGFVPLAPESSNGSGTICRSGGRKPNSSACSATERFRSCCKIRCPVFTAGAARRR